MKVFVESLSTFSENIKAHAWTAVQVLLGGLFLATCAQIEIPLYPVPMTLQSLGVFVLAIMQGGKKASCSTLFYLALASFGLPVLSGGTGQAFWFAFPSAGYLVAFPIASFVIGKMVRLREYPSSLWILMSLMVGQVIIYTLGVAALLRFLTFKQSLMAGVVPFLPIAGAKLLIAASLGGVWLRFRKK